MEILINPIMDYLVCPLCGVISKHCGYVCGLTDSLNSLREAGRDLVNITRDVEARVDLAVEQRSRPRHEVNGWLESAQFMLREVDGILQRGDEEIQKTCLRKTCFPGSWSSRDKLGKEASEKIVAVEELIGRGHFVVVAEKPPRAPVEERPIGKTVGLDSIISEVWRCIEDHNEKVIGLYGMGGVGKTTLLKKLNNKFRDTGHDFDLVIWVKVSRDANLEKIQESILRRFEIPDQMWIGKDEDGRANEILSNLRGKKFVLLLDDVWERLDLSKVGVSDLLDDSSQTGSKIVFTTRSEEVCGEMGARRRFRVECLSPEAALDLFRYKVGEDVYSSHFEISNLAQTVVEECRGLPLALVTIGHAMASRMGPTQWRYAVGELQRYPFKFAGMGNSVFPILRFSYDSLREDIFKTCFLYCALFPEEHNITKDELIQLWTGEGFLNGISPRDQGEYIIESLKLACLLERGENSEDSVKMHNLIRDMALELASENDNKTLVLQNNTGSNIESINSFDGWHEAVRLSLWGSSIDFLALVEAPSCPQVRTLLARLTMLHTLPIPSRFFDSMDALEVLDLSYNLDLNQLPEEIGRLKNLHHLNLSNTSIGCLPTAIKRLIKLKVLLLDGIQCHLSIPEGVISSLSSLQVFSCFSTELVELIDPLFNETAILDELNCLEHLNDLSLTLFSTEAVDKLLNSPKLQRCIRRLTIESSELLSLELGLMLSHLEILRIKCGFMKRLNIDQGLNNRPSFSALRHLSIILCPDIQNLTCLVHVPSLQFLSLSNCHSLEEIVGTYASGSSESRNYFSNLMAVDLDGLPTLRSICSGTVAFPSLQTLSITGCPSLKKLPFNSESARRSLISVRASAEWWNQLEWEDEATKDIFTVKFQEMNVKR